MIISLIAALDEQAGIGLNNDLPWHLPADLARFRRLTMGHHLVMGRRTYQSIGKPLPGRQMIVLSRNANYHPDGCTRAASLPEAFELAKDRGENELFVIGGREVFSQVLISADRFYLTRVHTVSGADTFFPAWDESRWEPICSQTIEADDRNPLPSTFSCLIRKQG